MRMRRVVVAGLVLCPGVVAGCGTGGSGLSDNVTIVLNQPFQKLPYVGNVALQGAQIAADEINSGGGIKVGGKSYGVKLEKRDHGLSPTTALDNIKVAAGEKAVAVIDDGYTVSATFKAAADAGLPILVNYDGSTSIIDTDARPNVFRIAPADDSMAQRLLSYIAFRHPGAIAVAHDDSEYGKDGDDQVRAALRSNTDVVPGLDIELPSSATTYDTQALQLARSGAGGVIIWARSPVLAAAVKALRTAGFAGPIFSGPTAEDPVVRTQLADHPEWIDGLTYASFRVTAENGPDAWNAFRKKYEDRKLNGGKADYLVGVQTRKKRDVVQPPNWQIFSYDMVYLVKAALEKAGTVDPRGDRIIKALNEVQVKSANGDRRGWRQANHEGVPDDDIYFATFKDMKFEPAQDDPLSKSLPPVEQE